MVESTQRDFTNARKPQANEIPKAMTVAVDASGAPAGTQTASVGACCKRTVQVYVRALRLRANPRLAWQVSGDDRSHV